MTQLKILIVFYGIGRGGELSSQSYQRAMLMPLQELGCAIDTVHILKNVYQLNSVRSGEFGSHKPYGFKFYESSELIQITESDLDASNVYDYSRKFQDRHSDNYQSNLNLVHQLLKLELASRMVDFSRYNRVILLRDDLVFLREDINWKAIMHLSGKAALVSKWFWNAGISERFVVASPNHAVILANRISHAISSIDHLGYLNGEGLMRFVIERSNIKVAALDLRFARVRLDQRIQKERFVLAFWRPNELLRVCRASLFSRYELLKWQIKMAFNRLIKWRRT